LGEVKNVLKILGLLAKQLLHNFCTTLITFLLLSIIGFFLICGP